MKLNRFIELDFDCNNCQKRFYQDTAFSLAPNLDYLDNHKYPTYCFNCAKIIRKQIPSKKSLVHRQNHRKKTGRTHLLGIRGTKEWIKKLKSLARKQKLKYVEVLEKALECYEKYL